MNRIAAIQMASGPNLNANLIEADKLIGQAVASGAKLIVLPENFALMGRIETEKVDIREHEDDGQIQGFLTQQAIKHDIWIVGGTIPLVSDNPNKAYASCLVFNNEGQRIARYDKLHLFDVLLEESQESYTESATIEAGDSLVTVDTPFGCMGITVCYDLRFPELYRSLINKGVDFFVVPAAFTAMTGKAHWETLVRARAIENLSYVIAAAQGGFHVNGRATHGHSMIVDPWGTILDHRPQGSGFVIADINLDQLTSTRRNFPALDHRRQ